MDMKDSLIGADGAKDTRSDAPLKEAENMKDEEMSSAEPDGPPDGFQFVLPFLDLSSRLNVERVNKPLREALKDPLVWIDLRVDERACRRLTNEILLKLVGRADGHLKSLFLVDAHAIRDETLSRISEVNPGLERISVPGCTGLNVENFVSLVEAHSLRGRAKGLPGISQVRLGGLYNLSPEHLLRLGNALRVGLPQNEASPSRRYYGLYYRNDEAIDKRPVDVELCPHCKKVGLIYICTNSICTMEEAGCGDDIYCRSCIHCIPRCGVCGMCIRHKYIEDSLCGDSLCRECWGDLPQCIECNRPACPRHEDGCFPLGLDAVCDKCIEDSMEFEDLDDGIMMDFLSRFYPPYLDGSGMSSSTDFHEFEW